MSQNEFVTRFVGEFDAGDSVQKIELVEAALQRLLALANAPVETGGGAGGDDILAQLDQLSSALESRLGSLGEVLANQIRVALAAGAEALRTAAVPIEAVIEPPRALPARGAAGSGRGGQFISRAQAEAEAAAAAATAAPTTPEVAVARPPEPPTPPPPVAVPEVVVAPERPVPTPPPPPPPEPPPPPPEPAPRPEVVVPVRVVGPLPLPVATEARPGVTEPTPPVTEPRPEPVVTPAPEPRPEPVVTRPEPTPPAPPPPPVVREQVPAPLFPPLPPPVVAAPVVGPTGRTEEEQAAVREAARTAVAAGEVATATEGQATAAKEGAAAAGKSAANEKNYAERAYEAKTAALRAEVELAGEKQKAVEDARTQGAADRLKNAQAAKAATQTPEGRTEAAQTQISNVQGLTASDEFPALQAQLKAAYNRLEQAIIGEENAYPEYLKSFGDLKSARALLAAAENQELRDHEAYKENFAQLRRSTAELAAAQDLEVAATPGALEALAAAKTAREKVAGGVAEATTPEQVGQQAIAQQQKQELSTSIKGASLGLDPEALAQLDVITRETVVAAEERKNRIEADNRLLQSIASSDEQIASLAQKRVSQQQVAGETAAATTPEQVTSLATAKQQKQELTTTVTGAALGLDPADLAAMSAENRQTVVAAEQRRSRIEADVRALQAIVNGDEEMVKLLAQKKILTQEANAKIAAQVAAEGAGAGAPPAPPGGGGPTRPTLGGGFGEAFNPSNLLQFAAFNLQFAAFNAFQRTITDAISSALKLDQQLALVKARADAIGQGGNFESLRQNILQVSATTGVTGQQVAILANEFLGLYGNVDQANQATASAAQLIRVMGVNAATAAPEIAAMAEDFNTTVTDLGNNIIDAANKTGRSTADIAAGIAQISPEAKELGLTLNNVRGIVEAVGASSTKSGQAIGESLARVLPEIQSKLPALAELGFRFSSDAVTNTKVALQEILQQYGATSAQVKQAFAGLVGGPRQAQIVAALAQDPQKALQAMNSEVSSNTLLADQNAKVQATFAASLERLKVAATGVGEAFLHSGILQGLTDIISVLGDVLRLVAPVIGLFTQFNDALAGIPGRLLAVAAALYLVAKAITAIQTQGLVGSITGAVGGAVGGAGRAAAGAEVAGAAAPVASKLILPAGVATEATVAETAGASTAAGFGVFGLGTVASGGLLAGATLAVVAGEVIKKDIDGYAKTINDYRATLSGQLTAGLNQASDQAADELKKQLEAGKVPSVQVRPSAPSIIEDIGGFITSSDSKQAVYDQSQRLKDPANQRALLEAQTIKAVEKARAVSRDQFDAIIQSGPGYGAAAPLSINDVVAGAIKGDADDLKKLRGLYDKFAKDPKIGPILQQAEADVIAANASVKNQQQGKELANQFTAIGQGISDATGVQISSVQDAINGFQSGDLTFAQASTLVRGMADNVRSSGLGGTQVGAAALAAATKFLSNQVVQSVTDQINFAKTFLGAGPTYETQQLLAALQSPDLQSPADQGKLAQQLLAAQQAAFEKGLSGATSVEEITKALGSGYQVTVEVADAANKAFAALGKAIPFPELAAQEAAIQKTRDTIADAIPGIPEAAVGLNQQAAAIPKPVLPATLAETQVGTQQTKALNDQKVAQARLAGDSAVTQAKLTVEGDRAVVAELQIAAAKFTAESDEGKAFAAAINVAMATLANDQVAVTQSVIAQIQAQASFWQAFYKNNPILAAQKGMDAIRAEIAQAPYGNINKIMADIKAGTAGPEEAALGTQFVQAGQAATDASNALADAQGQYAVDLARSSGNTIAAARADVARLNGDITRLRQQGGGPAAILALQDQMLSAQAALRDAQNAVIDAQIQYAADLATAAGDPVKAGQYKIQELRTQIAQLKARGATTANSPELLGLLGQLAIAQTDQISTFINTAVQRTQDSLDLRRIGAGQAIAQLQATLQAAAAMGANQTQLDSLQKQINAIIKTTQGDLNWNLGQIQVPTLYQARRLEASGSGAGYQDNRQQAITINVHNAQDNPGAVNALLDAVGGPSRTGTALPVLSAL